MVNQQEIQIVMLNVIFYLIGINPWHCSHQLLNESESEGLIIVLRPNPQEIFVISSIPSTVRSSILLDLIIDLIKLMLYSIKLIAPRVFSCLRALC